MKTIFLKRFSAIASLMCLFLFIINVCICHAAEPYATLENIGKAIDAANSEAFLDLVDLDGLLDQSLATFLKQAQKPENISRMPPLLSLMFSQAAAEGQKGDAIRTLLKNEARAFVLNGINSGAFAGKKLDNIQKSGLLAPIFANASLGRKEIRGVGDATRAGDDYILPFTIHDYGSEQDYPIVGRFSQVEKGLRLSGIENLEQVYLQIQKEALAQDAQN